MYTKRTFPPLSYQTICVINRLRQNQGKSSTGDSSQALPPLKVNNGLMSAAQTHSRLTIKYNSKNATLPGDTSVGDFIPGTGPYYFTYFEEVYSFIRLPTPSDINNAFSNVDGPERGWKLDATHLLV